MKINVPGKKISGKLNIIQKTLSSNQLNLNINLTSTSERNQPQVQSQHQLNVNLNSKWP